MNVLSIRLSLKNIRVLAIGIFLFIGLITYNSFLPNSNPRLEAMSKILEGKSNNTRKLEEGGRSETWAIYYNALVDKPILGHGYGSFDGGGKISSVGPHNSFIKTWGESGILTLIVMLILFGLMIKKSRYIFLKQPHLFLMTSALFLFMMTDHSFWVNGYMLFFTIWLQFNILTIYNKSENIENSF
jgi:O-antigen ligase